MPRRKTVPKAERGLKFGRILAQEGLYLSFVERVLMGFWSGFGLWFRGMRLGWGDLFQGTITSSHVTPPFVRSPPRIIRDRREIVKIAFGLFCGLDPHRRVTDFLIGASRAAQSSSCVSPGYVLRPLRYYSSAIGALRRGAPPRSDRQSDAPRRGTRGGGGGRPNPNQSCPGWSHRGREGRARAPTCNARANGGPHVDAFSH